MSQSVAPQSRLRPNRLSVLFEWAGISHDGLRALRNATIHDGDTKAAIWVIKSFADDDNDDVERVRSTWADH